MVVVVVFIGVSFEVVVDDDVYFFGQGFSDVFGELVLY